MARDFDGRRKVNRPGSVCAWTQETAVKEEKEKKSEEGAGGIKERIPGGRAAGGHEDLVNFVEGGIGCGDEPSNESPGPAPGRAIEASGADGAIEQEKEDEVFDEMGGFADEVVNEVEGIRRDEREEPAEEWLNDKAGVGGGEGVRGKKRNDGSPKEGGPPGAEPVGETGIMGRARGCRVGAGCLGEVE